MLWRFNGIYFDLNISETGYEPAIKRACKKFTMKNITSKTAAIIHLQQKGYDQDFMFQNGQLYYVQGSQSISADDFEITEVYRSKWKAQSQNNQIVYAIQSVQNDLKGILMTTYNSFTQSRPVQLWS